MVRLEQDRYLAVAVVPEPACLAEETDLVEMVVTVGAGEIAGEQGR
jgi:hypothetical protein